MASGLKQHLPKLVALVIVAAGVLGFRMLSASRKPPVLKPPGDRGVAVRTFTVAPLDFIPRASAYGEVRAQKTWRAVAEVSGRIVEIQQRLRAGTFVKQGELLFVIDVAQYEIEVARTEAIVEGLGAQLAEIDVQRAQLDARLSIERQQLELAVRERDRLADLAQRGGASPSERDQQSRVVLDRRTQILALEQSIELLPTQRAVAEKQRAAEQARLARARLDVARCRITAPFDGRVASLSAEKGQVVGVGETLCTIHAVDVSEVAAPFGLARLTGLMESRKALVWEEIASAEAFRNAFDVQARVRFHAPGRTVEWPARFLRVEAVRVDTRTVPFVVGVDAPYANVVPGIRPPLTPGLYVEVELRGRPRPGTLVVPAASLRADGTVPVADADDRLRFAPVEIAFTQGELVVLRSGLEPGARVVLSDVIPAVAGMRLRPVADADVQARVLASAAGGGDVR